MEDYQDSQAWYSRVAKSASTLTQDLLESSYGATSDLATLRTAHKVGYNQNGGSGLTERHHPKLLSQRHKVNGGLKNSARRSAEDFLNDLEVEEEIVQFLGRQCIIEQQSNAGSSRSASPLSGDEGPSRPRESVQRSSMEQRDLSREGMFDGAIPEQRLSSTDVSLNVDAEEQHTQSSYPTAELRKQIAATLASRESAHFDTHWDHRFAVKEEDATSTLEQETSSSPSQDPLKQKASRRLQLISDHLAAHALSQQTIASSSLTKVRNSAFESSYNQLCHGEISQEWADFQAAGPFCFHRDVQRHSTPFTQRVQEPLHQADMQRATDARDTLEVKETLHSQNVAENEKKEEQESEPLSDFHCPWVGCRLVSLIKSPPIRFRSLVYVAMLSDSQHLEHGSQYIRNAEGELESLACVHEGCDEAFVEEAEWREHIMCAHHGILRTPRSETPVNSEEFERAWAERKKSR